MLKNVIKPEHKIRDLLLQVFIENEGSDMYITVWTYPSIKISWEIVKIDEWIEPLTWKDTLEFTQSVITEQQHDKLVKEKNLDFSFEFSGRRFRANVSFQLWNYMLVFRLLSGTIPNIEVLNLPDIYKEVTKRWQGLILVTWPTGSGKTTTLAAMIDYINNHYSKHIITIEDPIEYVHPHKHSILEHKEIWKDVPDYKTALMWAMRQNPQVLLFGEMRTREEMEMALTLAETWHLVFSTLHTRWAHQTITRILDSFTWPEKNQVRLQLADNLVAVFSQRLLKFRDGTWVKMAKEILVNNWAIANIIREDELHQIPSLIQMWQKEWMQLLEKDIVDYIKVGLITEEEWLKYSNNPKLIKEAIH